jgi:hypothetical protein
MTRATNIVMYSGFYSRRNFIALQEVNTLQLNSQKLFEHTYTSNPHGLGTLTTIEFFLRDLLWQSSNTHSQFCSQKASKHTLGQSIDGLSVHLHTTTAPRHSPSLTCHLPAPTIECLHRPRYKLTCSSRQSVALRITSNLYSFSDHTL